MTLEEKWWWQDTTASQREDLSIAVQLGDQLLKFFRATLDMSPSGGRPHFINQWSGCDIRQIVQGFDLRSPMPSEAMQLPSNLSKMLEVALHTPSSSKEVELLHIRAVEFIPILERLLLVCYPLSLRVQPMSHSNAAGGSHSTGYHYGGKLPWPGYPGPDSLGN